MSDRVETELLSELVGRKLRVLVQLRELVVRQAPLIEGDDMKTLLRVFAAKQKLLEEVHRLDAQLEPFRAQDPERRMWRSEADRGRCREAAEACQRIVNEVKQIELRDKDELIARREATAVQLEGAHAAAVARSAYRPAATVGRLDLSSES